MKTVAAIKAEIEKNKRDRESIVKKVFKYPDHYDYLTNDKWSIVEDAKITIKRGKGPVYFLGIMWLVIAGVTLFGAHAKENIAFLKQGSAWAMLFIAVIYILWPVLCLYHIFRKKPGIVIDEKAIYLPGKTVYFSDLIFIHFVLKRHRETKQLHLKLYYKNGDEALIPAHDWKIDRTRLGSILYTRMKAKRA